MSRRQEERKDEGLGHPPGVNTLALTISNANKIIDPGYLYDSAGNMTADGTYSYSYDAENRLATAAGVTYLYDGDGKRVKKSNGKLYWYGMGSDANTETDLTGNSPVEYIFFGGKRIARRDSAGAVSYYFADHLGSSRVVTNAAGTILDDSDFYPFGGERVVSSSSGNAYKFTGKERDSESGLDNFGARYNSSNLGRFMSPDPKIPNLKHLLNPQKWNKYAYTLNNPLRYVDPDGLEEIEVQLRAFIPQKSLGLPGNRFAGDNRGFTSAQNVTSRTSITVRIETDASKRPGNPIISMTQPGTAGQTKQLDSNGNVVRTATATEGLPTVTGTRDANGNAVLNFKQDAVNPLAEPQSLTPGIRSDLNVTVTQNALSVDATGTISGSPSFELNVGSTNIPLQTAPSSNLGFVLGLPVTNTVQVATPLPPPPPPPPPCATDKDKPCSNK